MSPRKQTAIFIITLSLMTALTYWMVTYHVNIWLTLNAIIIVGGAAATHWSLTKAQREMEAEQEQRMQAAMDFIQNTVDDAIHPPHPRDVNTPELHDAHVNDYNWHHCDLPY